MAGAKGWSVSAAAKIRNKAGAFKRGGAAGREQTVYMDKERFEASSPMVAMEKAGKVVRVPPPSEALGSKATKKNKRKRKEKEVRLSENNAARPPTSPRATPPKH